MAAQFATKHVANLGDDLDLRGMIIFRVFELMDGVLVINGVRWKMDEIARVAAQQSGTEKPGSFRVCAKFTEAKVVASQMQLADIAAFG
jgi:hypothetical protein